MKSESIDNCVVCKLKGADRHQVFWAILSYILYSY